MNHIRLKKIFRIMVGGALLLSSAACHHLEAERQAQLGQTKTGPESRSQNGAGSSRQAGLSAQELKPGDCGLFLWATNDTRRPLVFFRLTGSSEAEGLLAGQSYRLTLMDQADAVIPGLFLREHYSVKGANHQTVRLRLQVEQGGTMLTGVKIPGGIITVDDPKEGSRVTPVTGLYACQANS